MPGPSRQIRAAARRLLTKLRGEPPGRGHLLVDHASRLAAFVASPTSGNLFAALAGLAIANALVQSRNPPRGDDIVYLAWAMERAWPWEALQPMDLFPGWRPMNALSWWLAARLTGVTGLGSAVQLAGVWLGAWGAWTAWVRRRWGADAALWAAGLLLLTSPFRDLVLWRSWMTSTGAVACMGLCLLALESGWRRWALLAAAGAVGFKETAVLPLGLAAWLLYRDRGVPLVLALVAAPSWMRIALSDPWPGPGGTLQNMVRYVVDLARLGWPGIAGISALLLRRRPGSRETVIVASAAVLPLLYPFYNITYLLDGLVLAVCFVAAWLSTLSRRARLVLVVVLCLSAIPGGLRSALDVRYQWQQRARIDAWWSELVSTPPAAWRLDRDVSEEAKLLAMWIYYRLALNPDESRASEMRPFAQEARGLLVVPGAAP